MKFLKLFRWTFPSNNKLTFVCRIDLRNTKRRRIFSATKCAYCELSTGKNRKSGGILVDTVRGNFCISMAPGFSSSVGHLNLKIFKNHYNGVKV